MLLLIIVFTKAKSSAEMNNEIDSSNVFFSDQENIHTGLYF